MFSYSPSATTLDNVIGVKILFTTDFVMGSNREMIPEKRFNVRTVFFAGESVDEQFRGVTQGEIDQLQWSIHNLDGISQEQLLEYESRLIIQEFLINGRSTFDTDPISINDVTVVKLG